MKLLPLYGQSKDQLTNQIISQCLKGSGRAQRQLFDMYYTEGMNTAIRYSSNEEDAKEILSNAFIRIFKKLALFDISQHFIPWLKKIIVHASSDYYRYQNNLIVPFEQVPEPKMDDDIINSLSYQELLEHVQSLPPSLRSVFNLYCIEGFKHNEIGELLEISEGTSKAHLHRAKSRLQTLILESSKQKDIGPIRQEHTKKAIKGS
ncbi:MAG: sigma-70 family RNA polymerase sigma factor [Saprospiraceae bacterium]|nr:sigma-70 family RNA polymerase sigma factor [Saprospiraceae bacterium]